MRRMLPMWTSSRKVDSGKPPGHTARPSSGTDHTWVGLSAIARMTSTSTGVSGSADPSSRAIRRPRSTARPVAAAGRGGSAGGRWRGTVPSPRPERAAGRREGRYRVRDQAEPGAAQQRLHPGRDLAGREGLREVVVGAELEPDEAVDLVAAGGDHHDVGVAERADLAAHVGAVDVGQGEVERDQVGVEGPHELQRRAPLPPSAPRCRPARARARAGRGCPRCRRRPAPDGCVALDVPPTDRSRRDFRCDGQWCRAQASQCRRPLVAGRPDDWTARVRRAPDESE